MSASSWSLDQLRVSPSLQHFLMVDVGTGLCLGTGQLLRKVDYSQKATKSHTLQRLWICGLYGWTEGTPGVNTVTPVKWPRVHS